MKDIQIVMGFIFSNLKKSMRTIIGSKKMVKMPFGGKWNTTEEENGLLDQKNSLEKMKNAAKCIPQKMHLDPKKLMSGLSGVRSKMFFCIFKLPRENHLKYSTFSVAVILASKMISLSMSTLVIIKYKYLFNYTGTTLGWTGTC